MKIERKHIETTKILLVISWTAAIAFSVMIIILSLREFPTEGLQLVTPLAWAEVTALNGFYIWKSKNENRAKYAQHFINEIAEKYGVEAAALFADTVLKE